MNFLADKIEAVMREHSGVDCSIIAPDKRKRATVHKLSITAKHVRSNFTTATGKKADRNKSGDSPLPPNPNNTGITTNTTTTTKTVHHQSCDTPLEVLKQITLQSACLLFPQPQRIMPHPKGLLLPTSRLYCQCLHVLIHHSKPQRNFAQMCHLSPLLTHQKTAILSSLMRWI